MRIKRGVITSAKMDKTLVVSVHEYKNDPKYKKRYRVTKKFYAHDENNTYKE
jgi:small subunit ribosomal protein S17